MNRIHLSLFSAFVLLASCNSNEETSTTDGIPSDSLEFADFLDNDQQENLAIDIVSNDPDVQEAHAEIVKNFGEQWDFCTCIVKSDSVNTALMAAPDELFDKVMERSEYIDSKCKGLLIQPNATPEDRAIHEKRVKKCLKEAK
jgi:hypothetical protein